MATEITIILFVLIMKNSFMNINESQENVFILSMLFIITTFKLGISLGIGFCHQKQDNIVWKIFIVGQGWAVSQQYHLKTMDLDNTLGSRSCLAWPAVPENNDTNQGIIWLKVDCAAWFKH